MFRSTCGALVGGVFRLRNSAAGGGAAVEFRDAGFGSIASRICSDLNLDGTSGDGHLRFYLNPNKNQNNLTERFRISGALVDVYHVRVRGNLNVEGVLAKGGGTFLIDHPLDPENRDLQHGFVEAPEYLLVYRGRVKLKKGRAKVDIDDASRMTRGTFDALVQDAMVSALQNLTGFGRVRATEITAGRFEIIAEDEQSSDEVAWMVTGARKDAFIYTIEHVDAEGRMIPEFDKPAAPDDLIQRATAPRIVTVESDEERSEETAEEPASELNGFKGFPRHFANRKRNLMRKVTTHYAVRPKEEAGAGDEAQGSNGQPESGDD